MAPLIIRTHNDYPSRFSEAFEVDVREWVSNIRQLRFAGYLFHTLTDKWQFRAAGQMLSDVTCDSRDDAIMGLLAAFRSNPE